MVDQIGVLAASGAVPVIVHSMSADSPAVLWLRGHGIATYTAIEHVMDAISRAVTIREFPGPQEARTSIDESRSDGWLLGSPAASR